MTSSVDARASSSPGHLHHHAGDPGVLRTDFDVAAYVRSEQGPITVDAALVSALPRDLRRDLGMLARLEAGALAEARALLCSSTSREARITAFLAIWMVERHWSARALEQLQEAGGPRGDRTPPDARWPDRFRSGLRRQYVERLLPITTPVWTTLVGEPVAAGQMTRLALQERALLCAGEALLPRLSGESRRVLAAVCARRRRHLEFFEAEARARLRRSTTERSVAAAMLRGFRVLRTVGVADPHETSAVASLFRDPADRVRLLTALEPLLQEVTPALSARAVLPPISRRGHGLRP